MFWFDLLFSGVCVFIRFLLVFIPYGFHFKYTFVWGVYIKIESSYAKQQKNYILNEMKEWMNEKSSKIIRVTENIKSPRTHVHSHKKVGENKTTKVSSIYLFRLIYFENVLVKVTFCSQNYSSALFCPAFFISIHQCKLISFALFRFHCSQLNPWRQRIFDQIKSP